MQKLFTLLLQVALKTGSFEIAEYLIEAGIDVNFTEAEDDDPGLRAPVLFDVITATIDSLCINQFSTPEKVQQRFNDSDRAFSRNRNIKIQAIAKKKRSEENRKGIRKKI